MENPQNQVGKVQVLIQDLEENTALSAPTFISQCFYMSNIPNEKGQIEESFTDITFAVTVRVNLDEVMHVIFPDKLDNVSPLSFQRVK